MHEIRGTQLTVRVHLRWLDFSPALHHYTTERVTLGLHRFARTIREVAVEFDDAVQSRPGTPDRLSRIEVLLRPAGSFVVSGTGPNAYVALDSAVTAARTALRDHEASQPDLVRSA